DTAGSTCAARRGAYCGQSGTNGQVAGCVGCGITCQHCATLTKLLVGRKSTSAPVQARKMPCAIEFEIVELVMNGALGSLKILRAPSVALPSASGGQPKP